MKSIGVEPKENKPASEQRTGGGWARRPQAHKLTSPQAIRRQAVREPTSAECGPNHSLRVLEFPCGPQADRGSRMTRKVLRSLQEALEVG